MINSRALFGYEGQSNDLKVVSTGDGGISELIPEFNEGKIQYAFLRVQDPKTSLFKYVLIQWQGEGAPTNRKGFCAKHIRDISALLHGHHITIACSNEDDIDEDRIMKKIAQISSEYNFKERREFTDERVVVGTNYHRVIPTKEIDAQKRDEFWRKEEMEEKNRVNIEHERNKLENMKIEEERRRREEKEHEKREQITIEKKKVLTPAVEIKPQPIQSPLVEKDEFQIPKADQLRQERQKEAQELIGSSKVTATRALFMQNFNNTGQLPERKQQAPVKPIRKTIPTIKQEIPEPIPEPVVPVIMNVVEPVEEPVEPIEPPPEFNQTKSPSPSNLELELNQEDQFSTIKRSPYSKSNTPATPPDNTIETNQIPVAVQQEVAVNEDEQYFLGDSEASLKARALYDYQAADETEISFDPGDIITHIDQIDEGWWQGLGPDGTFGLFPANYVELI